MGFFSDLFNPSAGYDAAQKKLDEYYQKGEAALSPYSTAGQNALPGLQSAGNSLLDPVALRQNWLNSYNLSPEAKMEQEHAKNYGLEAAQSMGLLGSSPALKSIQSTASQIGLQDQQNYLADLMDKYKTGIGVNQNLYDTGASSASSLANLAQNMGQNSAEMQYGSHSAWNNLLGNLGGGALGYALGGGPGALSMLMGGA